MSMLAAVLALALSAPGDVPMRPLLMGSRNVDYDLPHRHKPVEVAASPRSLAFVRIRKLVRTPFRRVDFRREVVIGGFVDVFAPWASRPPAHVTIARIQRMGPALHMQMELGPRGPGAIAIFEGSARHYYSIVAVPRAALRGDVTPLVALEVESCTWTYVHAWYDCGLRPGR